MTKISVIFKPSRKSGIMSDLQYMGYYEINNIDEVKNTTSKKILVHSNYEKLAIDYEKAQNLKDGDIIVLVISIDELFE